MPAPSSVPKMSMISMSNGKEELLAEAEFVKQRFSSCKVLEQSHYGSIYLAKNLNGDEVVLKMVSRKYLARKVSMFSDNKRVVEDLQAEMQSLCASARHPHRNVAKAATCLNGALSTPTHFAIAMDAYNGGDLWRWLRNHGPVSIPTALSLTEQVLSGLQHMHDVIGISHNDLSLENVMLHFDGLSRDITGATPVIIDFGLARPVNEAAPALLLKPAYRAPEQFGCGRPVCYRRGAADVYSVGMILCYLMVGLVQLYTSPDHGDKYFRKFQGPRLASVLRRMSATRKLDVPADVVNIVQRMTCAAPQRRATVNEALALVRAARARHGSAAVVERPSLGVVNVRPAPAEQSDTDSATVAAPRRPCSLPLGEVLTGDIRPSKVPKPSVFASNFQQFIDHAISKGTATKRTASQMQSGWAQR